MKRKLKTHDSSAWLPAQLTGIDELLDVYDTGREQLAGVVELGPHRVHCRLCGARSRKQKCYTGADSSVSWAVSPHVRQMESSGQITSP